MSGTRSADPATIAQTTLQTLSLANIARYYKQRGEPNRSEQHKIDAFIQSNQAFQQLATLVDEFIDVYDHHNALAGLTPTEATRLNQLAKIRNAFKKSHRRGEYDGPAFRKFIANEKKIVRFNKSIEWWQTNIGMLKKLELWEKMNTIIVSQSNADRISPDDLTKRLHKLHDIKQEWSQHQLFAAFSTNNLISFYVHYIGTIENTLRQYIIDYPRIPHPVSQFIQHQIHNVQHMRKQAIYSMIARLKAMDKTKDIENDDILYGVMQKIENDCSIKTFGSNLKPPPRKGLTPSIIKDLTAEITQYIHHYPQDSVAAEQASHLQTIKTPSSWATYNKNDKQVAILNKSPIVIFAMNQLPELMGELSSTREIYMKILMSDEAASDNYILARIKNLLAQVHSEISNISQVDIPLLDKDIIRTIQKHEVIFNQRLKDIHHQCSIGIRNKIQKSLDNIFSEQAINYEHIAQLSDQLMRSEEFEREYMTDEYNPDNDIVFAVSERLKEMVEKQHRITSAMLDKACKLLIIATDNNTQTKEIRKQLDSLPLEIRKINANDDPYILHYITHHIESFLLTRDNIAIALQRHEYIASLYDEQWRTTSTLLVDPLDTYIQHVFMPLIKSNPEITLDNFDQNNIALNIIAFSKKINDNNNKTHGLIKNMQYEAEIAAKLNHLFDIKKYIYDANQAKINTRKLKSLINRVDGFFTDATLKHQLIAAIDTAVVDLAKNYIITIIQANKSPDFDYLHELQVSSTIDVFSEMANDHDITRLLVNYVDMYSGAQNIIGQLLTSFNNSNKHLSSNDVLHLYASKRLKYIDSTQSINQQDYIFFNYFENHAAVKGLFKSYKHKFKKIYKPWIKSKSSWSQKKSMVIELFANEYEIDKYRFKRVRELLSDAPYDNQSDTDRLNAFFDSINTNITFNGRIITSNHIIINKTTLKTYFDYTVNSKSWTPIIDRMIKAAGSVEQIQTLNFRYFITMLSKLTNNNELPLLTLVDINETTKTLSADGAKQRYIKFIGKPNIKKLCVKIENTLSKLQAVRIYTSKQSLSDSEYTLYQSMIKSLSYFNTFYHYFTEENGYTQMMRDLPELKSKIDLHQSLHQTIKEQTSLLSIANENSSLHNAILLIMKKIVSLEDGDYITAQNTSHYINFVTDEIISSINSILTSADYTLTIPVIMTLQNLLSQIVSNNLKNKLVIAHKEDALKHPIWLMLINHMDESDGVKKVIDYLSQLPENQNPGNGFSELLTFSSKLTRTSSLLRKLMKYELLEQAGLNARQLGTTNFSKLTKQSKLSHKQLSKLWSVCLNEIANLKSQDIPSNANFDFLVTITAIVGEALSVEANKDIPKLKTFMKQFQAFANQVGLTNLRTIDDTHLLYPIADVAHLTLSTIIKQHIIDYTLERLPNEHHNDYLAIYDKAHNQPAEQLILTLHNSLNLDSRTDAIEIMYLLKVQHQLNHYPKNAQQFKALHLAISNFSTDIHTQPQLLDNKKMKLLTTKLSKLASYDPQSPAQDLFEHKSTWTFPFSF